ncbi:MAG: RluA family pseudouridine synthase [Clostridia bacterium]|nr:RluA family pseudouridine synthase [Clostridia bacterium]
MKITVEQNAHGMKTGEFLKKRLACSSKMITLLKKDEQGIMLNGKRVTVREILKAGDILEIADRDTDGDVNPNIVPGGEMPEIIYEDEDIIAVNKPPNMPTHPSHGHYEDTLANALVAYFTGQGTPFVFRSMNRLDRDTSGIVVVSKNRLTANLLSKALLDGRVTKQYFAVTDGIPKEKTGRIESDIRRVGESIIIREALPAGEGGATARYALTEYSVVSEKDGRAGVIVTPRTGRTHQIRVHFKHIGTPLLGDGLYGVPSPLIERHALHAAVLEFPYRGSTLRLTAPPPSNLLSLAGAEVFDLIF